MRKLVTLALATLFVLGLGVAAMAGDGTGITGSVHDMRQVLPGTTEVCGYCHAPHSAGRANSVDGPLWAHDESTGTYTMYASGDIDGATDAAPSGNSKACLGCHDGTIGVDQYQGLNSPSSNTIDAIANSPSFQIPDPAIGGSVSTPSLQGTHPISIVYEELDAKGNPSLKPAATSILGTAGYIADYLQNGKVQCSTCHDVHNDGNESVVGTPLLRADDAGSVLCTSCHIK